MNTYILIIRYWQVNGPRRWIKNLSLYMIKSEKEVYKFKIFNAGFLGLLRLIK